MTRGRFITFEGLDGAGKSTHISAVKSAVESRGVTAIQTREPGGTKLGEKIRNLVLGEAMDPMTELLLVFAARQRHVTELIRPALDRGEWIVCDRFTDASFAYQGGGRQVPSHKIEELEQWVHSGLQPDLTLLFDISFETARRRIDTTRDLDRFELEAGDFHERVRRAYLDRAATSGGRIVVIDASLSESAVRERVLAAVEHLFQ